MLKDIVIMTLIFIINDLINFKFVTSAARLRTSKVEKRPLTLPNEKRSHAVS